MTLYPLNRTPELDPDVFRHPPSEYRGTPLWSWNTKLDQEQLMQQIEILKGMGMGGFHIHPRTGLATEYLGPEFMDLVRASVEKARREGMLAWLYDEDRWPSGFAGGLVTRDARHRAKHLLYTPQPYDDTVSPTPNISAARAARFENGVLLARHQVLLQDGRLAYYRRLEEGEPEPDEGRVWYAYLETAKPSPWWNNQTYADTLSRVTIEQFIHTTHERYLSAVGDAFGKTIPAIFTDEPQFVHKKTLRRADDEDDLFLPWTTDFGDTYAHLFGEEIFDVLPEVFWELPDGAASSARYRYHDHLAERFSGAFADTIGAWCEAHNLMLTGHMMEEPTLASQTSALGEAMRSYRSFHLPGIDMLCDSREYTTAKQAQSAARQYGRPGVMSELYGVTNWDFDFKGHKAQGDWQAALGVTVRVQHLSWVSMAGEAKRDYPASISYQSPWWREYPLVENHFARLNTVLTRGTPLARVAVVHPIESYWLAFGPLEQTEAERSEREDAFARLTEWLLFGLIDFDFLAESLLPELCRDLGDANPLPVGAMRYDVVVVPGLRTLRASTLDVLEAFRDGGGQIVFTGEVPTLVDAVPSDRALHLAERCVLVPFTQRRVLETLEPFREVAVRLPSGTASDSLLHQVRVDGGARHVFLCNTDRERARTGTLVRFRGEWRVAERDTFTGETRPVNASLERDWTVLEYDFAAHGHLLVTLTPGPPESHGPARRPRYREVGRLADPVPVTLSEPNVLLLDRAAFRLDDGPWEVEEEVLRLDNRLRERLGWPLRLDALAQPWSDPSPVTERSLKLRFEFHAAVPLVRPQLALEDADRVVVDLNGTRVERTATGWWVDEAICTLELPDLATGTHVLELTLPYGRHTNVEWCYLLGDFGVEVHGRHARLTGAVQTLAFGDWTRQGLPFYAGNVTYNCALPVDHRHLYLSASKFRAPLLSASLNGSEVGKIAFAPYLLDLGPLAPGVHQLDLTAYGNRVNAFGCLHNVDPHTRWYGPNAWRSEGDAWADEYQLRPTGILVAPRLLEED